MISFVVDSPKSILRWCRLPFFLNTGNYLENKVKKTTLIHIHTISSCIILRWTTFLKRIYFRHKLSQYRITDSTKKIILIPYFEDFLRKSKILFVNSKGFRFTIHVSRNIALGSKIRIRFYLLKIGGRLLISE